MTICQLSSDEEALSLFLNALECVYKTWILLDVTRSKKRRDLTICWLDISQNIKEPTIQSEQYKQCLYFYQFPYPLKMP